ncbi:GNAT family N-acetyltransferase [Streptomyces acidiscabies]|uniref:GNAT family N-acetyltransferase n=1 Tax=Streptomyces acidiscabies TaxID=42234 RepID=A0AAP6EHL1_9ACTN|nr:GNAT family N-acetyltransferase [Streptomyces acidiscabies]MBP5938879.1 GNAT family N-acetyltransferase [Streptomyces sp. LBUM 1476]MBZ3909998.1 GNAT family N-acetyltransferase [Streptomyces acidiscabies]MDX2962526.1 GNAT family N-acetyltransferase [Streptomyces acidiscabies]GAQ52206.1 acetyltransferase (GNAT) family protein [Streptomyces acidiscabies]GAV39109.1 acetyltransferase (GNAT) family protein [Streptomyces acidiscabies]
MIGFRIESAVGERPLEQWRHVHNTVVPPAALSLAEVEERAGRYRLENAYVGDVLVGCSTVRPPREEDRTATVIARVLPEFRGRGYGGALYRHALAYARGLGAEVVETCVLAVNTDGLAFARARGFDEVERYTLEDGDDWWVDLRTPNLGPASGNTVWAESRSS